MLLTLLRGGADSLATAHKPGCQDRCLGPHRGVLSGLKGPCVLPLPGRGGLASPPPRGQNTHALGTPGTPSHTDTLDTPSGPPILPGRCPCALMCPWPCWPEPWPVSTAMASVWACLASGVLREAEFFPGCEQSRGPDIPQEGGRAHLVPSLGTCTPGKAPGEQTSPSSGRSPVWLRPRKTGRGFGGKGPPCSAVWGLSLAPGLRSSVPARPPRRVLTCGCWAGSCGRPGTKSPAAAGSWRRAGRG